MVDDPTHTEIVYGNLLAALVRYVRKEDKLNIDKIMIAAGVFEYLWPDDVARFEARYGPSKNDQPHTEESSDG